MAEPSITAGSTVAVAKKQPPPEKASQVFTRRQVVAAFWAVVVLLGLPIWWKTTTVYRATLPLTEMLDWADGKACRPVFPLKIAVDAPSIASAEATNFLKITQHALDDLNEFSTHHLRLQLATDSQKKKGGLSGDDDVALHVNLIPSKAKDTPRAELQPYSPAMDVQYTPNQVPSSSSTSSPLASFLASELLNVFAEEQATVSELLSSVSSHHNHKSTSVAPSTAASIARRTTRSFKYAPTYHLTFSLFTPTSIPSSWSIEEALKEYIEPLTTSFSRISNFTIDTQVQLYASLSQSIKQPEFDASLNAWTLAREDLPGFINAAEWPLSPNIGASPTINFVIYVPDASQSPLLVKENSGTTWLIPQWGAVSILNPPYHTSSSKPQQAPPTHLTAKALAPALLPLSHHLLTLLGLPAHTPPHSLPLHLSTLSRLRTSSLLLSASQTLGSLARLSAALPNIAIPDPVAHSTHTTIARLHDTCKGLREGRFADALASAREAEGEVEKAFFERSMVGQVYFPEEHKVAVYLPLMGPVSVPLVLGAVKELKAWLRARGARGVAGA